MNEKINVLIGANIEGLKKALAESGKSLSDFGTLAQQAPKKAKTAVDELNISYRNAVRDAKNLYLMQGQTSEAFYEAELKAKNLKTQIQQLNEVVGQTGQIAAGSGGVQQASHKFDMLGHSVNQITRELPAFTNSMTTGFMAISNNIPMLVDQINNIRRANESLVASGQPVKSVFSQLASSLFSWQTALSLGVTALTIYGAKIVDLTISLFDNDEAIRKTQQSIDALTISTANNAAGMELLIQIYGQTLGGKTLSLFQARENKEKRFQEIVKQTQAILAEESITGKKNILGRNMVYFSLLQNTKAYNKELADIEKKAAEDIKKSRVKIDKALEEGLSHKNQMKKFKGQLPVARKLKPDLPVGKIEFLIDTKNAMTGFDRFLFEFNTRLDEVEARVGKWSEVMAGLLSNAAVGLGEAIVTKDYKSYGESILRMLGDLAIQIGSAIIALGTAMSFGPTLLLGLSYIAGGTGLVILGSAMKANNVSSPKKPNTNSSGDGGSSYGGGMGGNIPSFNPTGMMISIDGLVRGNNIVVALDNQTRMNRRVR
jgi:hypothetical protein